ncbi:MAG TPA: TonB-dependent receptor [Longimicrobiales bacterium]|nr:TonB-dependent receptor [Longimicrobiales bacterium]
MSRTQQDRSGASFVTRALMAAAVAALAFTGSAAAQGQVALGGANPLPGVIAGQVVAESTGEGLPGAQVLVRETGVRVVADEAGRFRVDGVRAGRYTLDVSLLGRTHGSERVDVQEGRTLNVSIELGMAPVTLEALTARLERTEMVGGQLTRIPGSAHVLTADRLAAQKLAFDDVHMILRQVPGVNVSDEEGFGRRPNIGMRGTGVGRNAKITVMEDGVLIAPAPYTAPAAYLFPVAGRMESIEVRKGSSQVRYGPWSTGGALNLVTSSIPARTEGLLDMSGGEHTTGKLRARVGSTHGQFGWLAETYQLRTDGFKQLDTGDETGFDLQDYMLKLRLSSAPASRFFQDVELKLSRTAEASRETYLGLADTDFAAAPLRRYAGTAMDRLDTEATQYQLRHFIRPAAGFDVTTTIYQHEFARTWYKLDRMNTGSLAAILTQPEHATSLDVLRGANSADNALLVRNNNRDYMSRGIQSVVGLQFSAMGEHALEIGARYHYDSEDRFQHDDAYRMRDGRMELTTAGAPGSQDNRMGEARALALFAQDRITVGDWTLTPGVRYENIDFTTTRWALGDVSRADVTAEGTNSVSVWVPGVGLSRVIGRHGQLYAGVHRGFGPPGAGADNDARPESSVNYELGGRFEMLGTSLQASAFYNDYTNILGRATLASGSDGSNELYNGGAATVRGLEVSADYDVARDRGWGVRVPVRAAYTYTDATFQSAFQSSFGEWGTVEVGDELPYLPRHQGSASVGVEAPRWRLDLSAVNAGAARTVAGSGALQPGLSTDAYTVFSLSGEVGVTSWTRLYAGVQNLTDATYVAARRPFGARPGLPRTVTLGLRALVQ